MTEVAAAVVKTKDEFGRDQYLLIQSTKDFGEYTGYWYPVGKHIEGNSPEQTLKVLLKVELNLSAKPLNLLAKTKSDIPDQTIQWWECEVVDDKFGIKDPEISDAEYFTKDQMTVIHIWPSTKKFFEDYIFKGPIK